MLVNVERVGRVSLSLDCQNNGLHSGVDRDIQAKILSITCLFRRPDERVLQW